MESIFGFTGCDGGLATSFGGPTSNGAPPCVTIGTPVELLSIGIRRYPEYALLEEAMGTMEPRRGQSNFHSEPQPAGHPAGVGRVLKLS